MTITREQVADLQPGDVVEISGYPSLRGATARGPLWSDGDQKLCVGPFIVRHRDGTAATQFEDEDDFALTVVSRAPRPLYVNHPRRKPTPGDVVRGTQVPGVEPGTWTFTFDGWVSTRSGNWLLDPPRPARLLVDGETGQAVQ